MKRQKKVAAVHDISCMGKCSLTVALPIISAAGFETCVIPTAILSTHTGGFVNYTYRDLTEDIKPIAEHWKSLDVEFDALYSGFLGSFAQIDLVAEIFEMFKKDGTLIMVDPVMADNGKFYSVYSEEMARGMAKLCQKADIIVPNLTEAAFILGEEYVGDNYDREYVERTLKKISALGIPKVVLTGVSFDTAHSGAACLDGASGEIHYVFRERIEGDFYGTGDIFASTLLSALLKDFSLEQATRVAVDYVHDCIALTFHRGLDRKFGVCFEENIPYLIGLLISSTDADKVTKDGFTIQRLRYEISGEGVEKA